MGLKSDDRKTEPDVFSNFMPFACANLSNFALRIRPLSEGCNSCIFRKSTKMAYITNMQSTITVRWYIHHRLLIFICTEFVPSPVYSSCIASRV